MGDVYFMSSDVARIVLGYLKESCYSKTYNCFLKECSDLKEIYNLERAGRSLKKVTQFNLIKILEEWGHLKFSSENSTVGGNNYIETPSSDETVDETLICDNDVTNSGRKINARARSSVKKSPQVPKGRSPCTPKPMRLKHKSPRNCTSSSEQVAKETKSVVKNSDRAICEHSNKGKLNEVTPKKSPLSVKRTNSSEKAVKTESSSQFKKDEGALVNDTGTEMPDSEIRTKTCYPDNSSRKDAEQPERVCNDHVNSDTVTEVTDSAFVSEPQHRKTQNTSGQSSDKAEVKEDVSAASKIMSETFVKTGPASTCNSAANERCIAWLKKNSEVIKDKEHCDTNGNLEHSSLENLNDSQNVRPQVQQDNSQLVDAKTQDAHIDECSNDVMTSKSSTSTDTLRSNSPDNAPGTNTSGQGSNLQNATQLPLHVTPKKKTPEAKEKNFTTPMKILQSMDHHASRSPRRKKPKTPRKRISEVSPVSVVSAKSVDPGGVNPIFEKILSDHRLHEKLAETCNLVHSQIKMANSGKENKSDTKLGEQISPVPTNHSYDQETVTASQLLEEILGLDHNFHADMLSDNIDMSDPAYASLFKLFGTDRETFNEYLRKEKEKELALMEAEVEELERSNHEILCAIGVSNADAGYETQELAYSSPHHAALGSHDLFPNHHGSQAHSSNVFSGMKTTEMEHKISPCSTATQPFSPAYSNYSDVNNPPTPRNQQNLSTYVNGNSPRLSDTPRSHFDDPYSNPNTPLQSNASQVMHSTPTGPGNPNHFHLSSPIHSQHSAVKNSHTPVHCSPLVKADIHPRSPLVTHTNGYHSDNNGLYFRSQMSNEATNKNENVNNGTDNMGYNTEFLQLLQNQKPCTTIENTIGCISLPQPQNIETKQSDKKKGTRSRRKREPVKRNTVSASHATVKTLLEKPLKHLNRFPLPLKIADLQVCRTPEKRPPENLTFRSPGGKTIIDVPVLNCEDQIDLSVLGMDENVDGEDTTANVYDQKLDSSTQYSIAPENQATHKLMSAIEAGQTLEVVQQINKTHSDEAKQKMSKRLTTDRKTRARKKKEEKKKDEQKEHASPTPSSSDQPGAFEEGQLDPNQEFYTATPFTSSHKAATVRALNFGPNVDDPDIAHYRKIYPKLHTTVSSPSVLILNTNQVINPGHNVVVNSTPITLVRNVPKQCNPEVDHKNNTKDESLTEKSDIIQVEIDNLQSDQPASETVTNSESVRQNQGDEKVPDEIDFEKKCDTKAIENTPKKVQIKSPRQRRNVSETPKKLTESCKQSRNLSKEIGGEALGKDSEERLVEKENEYKENKSEVITRGSAEISGQRKEENSTKAEKEVIKCKKIESTLKTSKSKGIKVKEKLKVKIPVGSHKSPKGKKVDTKHVKVSIPFYFKKKNETKFENDSGSSDEDVPLSVLRNQQIKDKKQEPKPIEIVVESESTDDEEKTDNIMSTKSNSKKSLDETENTSKELLFEKIGLTPTKSLSKYDLKSPNRANALDVMAEWQRSPLSTRSRGLTPNTRNRFSKFDDALKQPTTPKRKTHTKQLFTSPVKEKKVIENDRGSKGKHTAKRVEKIIDRLKQNNPGKNLDSVKRNRKRRSSRKGKRNFEVIENPVVSDNKTEIIGDEIKEKESLNTEKDKQLNDQINDKGFLETRDDNNLNNDKLNKQINEEELLENKEDNNLVNDEFVAEGYMNNSVIENGNEEAAAVINDALILDENSQSVNELHRAVASIEFDHSDIHQDEEQFVQVHQYNQDDLNDFYTGNKFEEPMINFSNAHDNHTEMANTVDTDVSSQIYLTQDTHSHIDKGWCNTESEIQNEQVVVVDVHCSLNDQNSNEPKEEFQKSRNDVEKITDLTDSNMQNTVASTVSGLGQSESVTQTYHNAESSHDQSSQVESVTTEHGKRKSNKKKKRKHRHCHRHSVGSGAEITNMEGQFVSPGEPVEGENHRHSHKKKKKKSKKRHREESEDGHESKRRRKEKRNISLDSLAALNVDEALSQIYGKQSS